MCSGNGLDLEEVVEKENGEHGIPMGERARTLHLAVGCWPSGYEPKPIYVLPNVTCATPDNTFRSPAEPRPAGKGHRSVIGQCCATTHADECSATAVGKKHSR